MKKRLLRLLPGVFLAPLAMFAQTLAPSQDAYVVPGAGANYGSGASINVGSSGSQGLIQFDLTALPAGVTASQVQKAILTVFVNKVGAAGTLNFYEANGA